MVGVAGRSKACNTCKKRKVACTLEKPECSTCIKASRVCGGYHRERVFILHQDPRDQRCKTKATIPSVPDENGIGVGQNGESPSSSINQRSYELQATSSSECNTPQIYSPSCRSAYRDQILAEYISSFYPRSWNQITQGSNTKPPSGGTWLTLLPSLPEFSTALEATMLAVCTAKLGRASNDPLLVHESLKFYTQGLWELQRALWSPKLMYKDQTLAACMALILYEVYECPDRSPDGWTNHMKGCAKLFELRGPKAYASEFEHHLFLTFRHLEIQQAMAERRSTFLTNGEWNDLPWKGFPKHIHHRLLDIVAELANTTAMGYRILGDPKQLADPAKMLSTALDLINQSWKLDAKFRAFNKRFETETDGPIYWPELSVGLDDSTDASGKMFPVAFKFPNLGTAHVCMMYWATSAILWSGMGFLYKLLLGFQIAQEAQNTGIGSENEPSLDNGIATSFHTSLLPPLEHRVEVAELARNICQSLEFCMQGEHRDLGSTACIFPLKVAIEIFHDSPGCDRELAWGTAAMGRIAGKGVRLMQNLGVPITDHAYIPG